MCFANKFPGGFMADKILIIDDDPSICRLLKKVMTSNGFESTIVNDGLSALRLLDAESFSVILLDVTMNGIDGFEVVERLRKSGIHTPVMIVSGRNEDYDTLYGLSLGADDYITKPFNPVILGAKVKALMRRDKHNMAATGQVITRGRFSYDTLTFRFYKDGEEILLSSKENSLMHLFMRRPDQVFTKDMIYEQVWGDSGVVDDNAIMVYMNRLRNKVEDNPQKPEYIITVRGLGYRFTLPSKI